MQIVQAGKTGIDQQSAVSGIRNLLGLPATDLVPTIANEDVDSSSLTSQEQSAMDTFLGYLPTQISDKVFRDYFAQHSLEGANKANYEREVLNAAGLTNLQTLRDEADAKIDGATEFVSDMSDAVQNGGVSYDERDDAISYWAHYVDTPHRAAGVATTRAIGGLYQKALINHTDLSYANDFTPPVQSGCVDDLWAQATLCYFWLYGWLHNATDPNGRVLDEDHANFLLAQALQL